MSLFNNTFFKTLIYLFFLLITFLYFIHFKNIYYSFYKFGKNANKIQSVHQLSIIKFSTIKDKSGKKEYDHQHFIYSHHNNEHFQRLSFAK